MGLKNTGPKKNYWMVFDEGDNVDYIEKEITKAALDLNKDVLEMRALIFKAFAYDPEVRAKIIEYIKKNGQGASQ
jgi:hypothetical protein